MRILLTGISGQVGSALVRPLGAIGTVLPLDRDALDLSKPDTIADVLGRLQPDLIVNPAAYTAVDRAEDEPDLAYRVNAEAPGRIADWAARHDVPLVHLSTDYVFDGAGEGRRRESAPPAPLSVYGASKLAGEEAIRAAKGPHLVIRTSWVYAARGTNFLRTVARLAAERTELRIVADQVGAPTSARALADGISDIIAGVLPDVRERFAEAEGLVHFSASGETSWHGFATAIVDGLRARGATLRSEQVVPIRTDDYPTKAQRPRNSRFDLSRLRQVFGIVPAPWTRSLDVELEALIRELLSGGG